MTSAIQSWLFPVMVSATFALAASPSLALADDGGSTWTAPYQRLSIGAGIGGMGAAAVNASIGFDPYSQVEFEVAARVGAGSMEKQDDLGFPDYDADCSGAEDVYPCATNGAMFSLGLILGKHNTWEDMNKGIAIRTGISTLGEVYTSVGPRIERGLNENHTLTWNADLGLGYWFAAPSRAPTDLLALPWSGINDDPFDQLSQRFLLALRIGVQFYPTR